MGRTPPWARSARSLALIALISLIAALAPAASGKKPDGAGGQAKSPGPAAAQGTTTTKGGNGNGRRQAAGPTTTTTQRQATTDSTAPATTTKSRGKGRRAAVAAPTRAQPVQQPAAAAPAAAIPAVTTARTAATRRKAATTSSRRAAARRRAARSRRAAATARRAGVQAQRATRAAGTPAAATGATAAAPAAARRDDSPADRPRDRGRVRNSPVVRTLERVVEVIPPAVKATIAALAALLALATFAWFLRARKARFLSAQREMLLEEVGVLQGALLPAVPAELSSLEASVAYKPAEGLAAGGDFYDAFALDDGRVGILVGDIAGHGREALMHTALLRYTLRAYLEADLDPRTALQVAGRSLDRGFDTLATVVLAVYDPHARVLTYSCGGHPPPVFLGEADHVPVTVASSPPIGAGLPTGLRQTTVCLPAHSAVCFFTDGLIEARRGDDLIGRLGLIEIIRDLGPHATATQLLERVAAEADRVDDDMAACMFRVADGPAETASSRIEELEVRRGEPLEITLGRFLDACGVEPGARAEVIERSEKTMQSHRGAVVQVALQAEGTLVQVRPANVESFASAEAKRDATVLLAGAR